MVYAIEVGSGMYDHKSQPTQEAKMDPYIIQTVFVLIMHMYKNCAHDWAKAIQYAANDINHVIALHNTAVRKARDNGGYYYIDTSKFSDNQCVISSMLPRDQEVPPIVNAYELNRMQKERLNIAS